MNQDKNKMDQNPNNPGCILALKILGGVLVLVWIQQTGHPEFAAFFIVVVAIGIYLGTRK